MKKEQGITLIALVITIIVLLILAGVSISLILNPETGVITRANEAVEKMEIEGIKERAEMIKASLQMKAITDRNYQLTRDKFLDALLEEFENENSYLDEYKVVIGDEKFEIKVEENLSYTVREKTDFIGDIVLSFVDVESVIGSGYIDYGIAKRIGFSSEEPKEVSFIKMVQVYTSAKYSDLESAIVGYETKKRGEEVTIEDIWGGTEGLENYVNQSVLANLGGELLNASSYTKYKITHVEDNAVTDLDSFGLYLRFWKSGTYIIDMEITDEQKVIPGIESITVTPLEFKVLGSYDNDQGIYVTQSEW